MQIRICGYVAASLLLEQEPRVWDAIVLLDSATDANDFVKLHARSCCVLRFDDVEEPRGRKVPPSKVLIEEAIRFAKGKDKLLVTCRAGQGRSAALAYVIASEAQGSEEAIKLLNPTRHRPNRLIVSIGDSIVQSSEMLSTFQKWCERHANIRLSDYYDEIEKEFEAIEAQGASNKICNST